MSDLPKKVIFGPYTIELSPMRADLVKDHNGCWDFDAHKIWLATDFPSESFAASVVTHECIHGLIELFTTGLKRPEAEEEEFVDGLTIGFLLFLRDNKELIDWIRGSLK